MVNIVFESIIELILHHDPIHLLYSHPNLNQTSQKIPFHDIELVQALMNQKPVS